ncbi:MAG: hypothetical protein H6831_01670 [Planctomycetes bacterium]|nr:hypothetical protein [Planctomycetota bacterium]MCB9903094.1 hypothetical protein [Planctomycetota bacterium]
MLRHTLTVFALTFPLPLAAAQNTTHLVEDFDNGATDWFPVELVQMWHITAPGECGAPAGFATSALSTAPCRYGSPGWAWNSNLASPRFVPGGGPLELRFLSRLDIEAGDHAAVYLDPPSVSLLPRLRLGSEFDFVNDGNTESVTLWVPEADLYAGLECRLLFVLQHDGSADLGAGWAIDEVQLVETPVARPFCLGDGLPTNCPCANLGAALEGCTNSSGSGARLESSGSARIAHDDLHLRLSGAPAQQPAVLFRGVAGPALAFRDGLLCVGAPQQRIATLSIDASGRAETSAPLASSSGAQAGDRHHYQAWFRDPQGPCGQGSNLSSGVTIDWI